MRVGAFSEDYLGRDGRLRGMDARAKMIFSAACILASIASGSAALPLSVGALCTALIVAAGTPLRALLLRMSLPLGFALLFAVFQASLTGGEPPADTEILGYSVGVSAAGLRSGLYTLARVFGAVSAALFLTMTTPAHRLLSAAARLGLPRGLVEVSLFTYRYVFVLLEDASAVYQAQKGRLGYAGFRRGVRSLGTLAGSVLLRAYSQAEATGTAMSMRGYTGEYLPACRERLRPFDAVFLLVSFTLCLVVTAWTR